MIEVLAKLPATTNVYCGHEYTRKNLQFAKTVEPDNQALADRIKHCDKLRAEGKPTVPATMAEELATNPFMRVTDKGVQANVKATDALEAMATIRKMKDRF